MSVDNRVKSKSGRAVNDESWTQKEMRIRVYSDVMAQLLTAGRGGGQKRVTTRTTKRGRRTGSKRYRHIERHGWNVSKPDSADDICSEKYLGGCAVSHKETGTKDKTGQHKDKDKTGTSNKNRN
jgi:hypothetical protein